MINYTITVIIMICVLCYAILFANVHMQYANVMQNLIIFTSISIKTDSIIIQVMSQSNLIT